MNRIRTVFPKAALLSMILLGAGAGMAASTAPVAATEQPAVFARIGDTVITQDEYNAAYEAAARNKFFHGKAPEGGVALLQREVGEQMVTRVLLLREAKHRGIRPDLSEIGKTIQNYEKKYAGSEQWQKNRLTILPGLTARLEQESLLTQLESATRAVAAPDQKKVKEYYIAHPEKFTEPEQLKVSVILLKVDPSAPKAVWDKADEEAANIIKRLRGGADFGALARLHSGDPSAPQGGDMGYLHLGMLPDGAQEALSGLKPGELAKPIRLLQGAAIFKLTDRKLAKLNSFEAVEKRAGELLQRDLGEQAWSALTARLNKSTPAHIDQSRYLPLLQQPNAQASPK